MMINEEKARALVAGLMDSDKSVQCSTAWELYTLARAGGDGETGAGFRDTIRALWTTVGTARTELRDRLLRIFLSPDVDLLTMEMIGTVLALEGEDGATEIVSLLVADDFVLRHKAAIALGRLGPEARWAVPRLNDALWYEAAIGPQPLVVHNMIHALGCIGGAEALQKLHEWYCWERCQSQLDHKKLQCIETAIVEAMTQ